MALGHWLLEAPHHASVVFALSSSSAAALACAWGCGANGAVVGRWSGGVNFAFDFAAFEYSLSTNLF